MCMLNLNCYALCGFTQLCLIACPNNRVLGQDAIILCAPEPAPRRHDERLRIEFATRTARTAPPRRKRARKSRD